MNRYPNRWPKSTQFPSSSPMSRRPEDGLDAVNIHQTIYGPSGVYTQTVDHLSHILPSNETEQIEWLDICGSQQGELIHHIGDMFNLHPLVIDDIINTSQLPKIDEHKSSFFIIIKTLSFDNHRLTFDHIAIFFHANRIMSFQEKSTDKFAKLRHRIMEKNEKILEKKADYLVFCIIDYVIDNYFDTLQNIDGHISMFSDIVDKGTSPTILKDIQSLKKQVLMLKRYFWYTRDIILAFKKSESPLIDIKTGKYFNDLYDHIAHIIDISESFREEMIDLTERYVSTINRHSNDIMKTLTIMATIFMPLTFLAGVYGMNFKYMPELDLKWAYPIIILLMLGIVIVLLRFFYKKKWL